MVNCLVRMRKIKKKIAANMKSFIPLWGFLASRIQNALRDGLAHFASRTKKTDAHDARSWGLPGGFLASSVQNVLRNGLAHCAGVE